MMDKNLARAIIIASVVRAKDKRYGFYVYRKYVAVALKAIGLDVSVCDENQIQNIDKAESIYHFSLLGLLNRWLNENGVKNQGHIPENTLSDALEFLVKVAPVVR